MGYALKLELLKRRAEMLDAVSMGLHPSAVVAQLAGKYGVSERALWSDWERTSTTTDGDTTNEDSDWQPNFKTLDC